MSNRPQDDEFAVPPPDDASDVDSRNLSDLENAGDDDDDAGVSGAARRRTPDDSEGEDLMENMEGDYRPMPALDAYDGEDLDDDAEHDEPMDFAARARAEAAMARRDQREGRGPGAVGGRRGARLPGVLQEDLDDDDDDDDLRRPSRRRRVERAQATGNRGDGGVDGDDDEEAPPPSGITTADGVTNPSSFMMPPGATPGIATQQQQQQQQNDNLPELGVDLDNARGPPREYLAQEPVRRAVAAQFKAFLRGFADPVTGERVYRTRVREMCSRNAQSLVVSYGHLCTVLPTVAVWAADAPGALLPILHAAALDVALEQFPEFAAIRREVFVRLADLPIHDSIRDLRQYHLNKLVRVGGVATRRTGVFPMLQLVKYDCVKCRYVLGPFAQADDGTTIKLGQCPQCQSKGPFAVNSAETLYQNYQKVTVQEAPGSVPPGRLPRQKDVILRHDLIDSAKPGELIDVTGVYTHAYDVSLNARHGFPVFATLLEANHVAKRSTGNGGGGAGDSSFSLTDEDRAEVHALARDPRIGERIAASIAPSIYGHADIKRGLALALFGGQEKTRGGAHRLRGDINVLLLGDPGTAKSQFLKYVEGAAQRAVFATGKGASAVGLTAAVQRDPVTREWTLEGGALVLADRGVCLIDEFDKMNDADRVSIHEAMEQQSISISKAGIVTQLQARCSVIAAANPIGGRYDASRTFAENVELTEPILSRFDILFVVRDVVDPVSDARLAKFVVESHARAHPENSASAAGNTDNTDNTDNNPLNADGDRPQQPPTMHSAPGAPRPLTQQQLRKYIAYAKRHCRPALSDADADKISQVYARLRQESAAASGMPVAVRHLESIIRMAEAHASMHLRDHVDDADVDAALRVMLGSFVSTQKLAAQKAMRAKFARYLSTARGDRELLLAALSGLAREHARFDALLGAEGEEQGRRAGGGGEEEDEDDDDELGTQRGRGRRRGGRGRGGRGGAGGGAAGGGVTIPMRAVEERAREYGITSLSSLLSGPEAAAALADAGFRVDEAAGCIRVAEPAA